MSSNTTTSATEPSFVALSAQHSSGLEIIVGIALLSFLAIDIVWLRVLWLAFKQRGITKHVGRECTIFRSQLGAYVASLLLGNLLSSISYIMNSAWVARTGVSVGVLCTIQGGMSEIADVATAYFTAAMAVHTFNTLVLHHRLPGWCCALAVSLGWVIAGLMGVLPAVLVKTSGPFYGSDDVSCGISSFYPTFQTALHLLPIFVAALTAALFYSLVFLILRGTLVIRGGLKLNLDLEARRSSMYDASDYPEFIAAIARSMLWYPVAYIVLMTPHLLVCLIESSGKDVFWVWKTVSVATEASLGLANVVIFYNTIRIMKPAFHDGASTKASRRKTESFLSDPKNASPIRADAPVLVPGQAFPPPRSASTTPRPSVDITTLRPFMLQHSRQMSGESTRHLLSGHAHTNSMASEVSMISINRPIAPSAELNNMLSVYSVSEESDERDGYRSRGGDPASLPAPMRKERAQVMRHPTLPTVSLPLSPVDHSMLSAVPLRTAAPSMTERPPSRRDSFMNMYASRSPIPPAFAPEAQYAQSRLLRRDRAFLSPQSATSLEYSSDSDPGVPSGEFGVSARSPRPPVTSEDIRPKKSFRSAVKERLNDIDVPESGGLSSLAWATLVADAATSNGGVAAASKLRATRRRSRSLDPIDIPASLQPRTPTARTATLRREFTDFVSPPASAVPNTAHVMRWDSRANFRDGPSRRPTYRGREGVGRASTYR